MSPIEKSEITWLQVPFLLDTQYGVLEYMKKRLEQFGICVVVIAEGAGQVSLQFYLLGRMCAAQCIGEIFALW
jgi:hypothetical protein